MLAFVNAGHNAPIVLRNGEAIRLEAGGPVIGLLKQAAYVQAACQLCPGDMFIGYTDGISEAMTADDDEWGEERMIETARRYRDLPPAQIIERTIAGADAFTSGTPQYDDMTLVCVKVACITDIPLQPRPNSSKAVEMLK